MNNYHVKYTRNEDGSWTAQAVELPAAITQGRSIEQARTRLREAIQVVLDLRRPFAGDLVDEVEIPAPLAKKP